MLCSAGFQSNLLHVVCDSVMPFEKISFIVEVSYGRIICIVINLVHVAESYSEHHLGLPEYDFSLCWVFLLFNVGGVANDGLVDCVLDIAGKTDHDDNK